MNNGKIGGVGRKSISSKQNHFIFTCNNCRKLMIKTKYNFFCACFNKKKNKLQIKRVCYCMKNNSKLYHPSLWKFFFFFSFEALFTAFRVQVVLLLSCLVGIWEWGPMCLIPVLCRIKTLYVEFHLLLVQVYSPLLQGGKSVSGKSKKPLGAHFQVLCASSLYALKMD